MRYDAGSDMSIKDRRYHHNHHHHHYHYHYQERIRMTVLFHR